MGIDDIRKASKRVDEAVSDFVAAEKIASEHVAAAKAAEARAQALVAEAGRTREAIDLARKELDAACDGFFRPAGAPAPAPGAGVGAAKADAGSDHGRCPVTQLGKRCTLATAHFGDHRWV